MMHTTAEDAKERCRRDHLELLVKEVLELDHQKGKLKDLRDGVNRLKSRANTIRSLE